MIRSSLIFAKIRVNARAWPRVWFAPQDWGQLILRINMTGIPARPQWREMSQVMRRRQVNLQLVSLPPGATKYLSAHIVNLLAWLADWHQLGSKAASPGVLISDNQERKDCRLQTGEKISPGALEPWSKSFEWMRPDQARPEIFS